VAVMDWWSRYVLGWRLSNTLEASFCVDAWEAAQKWTPKFGPAAKLDFPGSGWGEKRQP
jgi:putative transposase